MSDALKNIKPKDADKSFVEFSSKVYAVQKEITEYIDKNYPIEPDLSAEMRKVLGTSLGTVLITIGLGKMHEAGASPIGFLEDVLRQTRLWIAMTELLSDGKENN